MKTQTEARSPNRSLWLVVALLVLTVCGIVTFVIISTGLWLGFNTQTGARVYVNVLPDGSDVFIDGQAVGQTPLSMPLDTGEHSVRVEREHFIPWEATISVEESNIVLERTLVFQPFVQTIELDAAFPYWALDGDLFYALEGNPPVIVRRNASGTQTLAQFSAAPLAVAWKSDGSQVAALMQAPDVFSLDVISLSGNVSVHVADGASAQAWKPDGNTLTYFAPLDETDILHFGLWSVEPPNNPQKIDVETIGELFGIAVAGWSPDGEWLFVIASNGLVLWRTDSTNERLIHIATLPGVVDAAWSPNTDKPRLAYVTGENYTLSFTDPNRLTENFLALNAAPPIRWMYDGASLLYFNHQPNEGGSSLWSVNLETGVRTLLADASIVPGHVFDFAISSDGKRVAYVTDDYRLVLLTLGE